jgi:cell division protein FtsI (penicillin-binding protein 3)
MSFVLQSRHIAPTGTVFDPIPLNKKALAAKKAQDATANN